MDPTDQIDSTDQCFGQSVSRSTFDSNYPYIYSAVVGMAFIVTAALLGTYDWLVNQRQAKTMRHAARTHALVTSLFPKAIGQRLVEEATNDDTHSHSSTGDRSRDSTWRKSMIGNRAGLQHFLGENSHNSSEFQANKAKSKPLAELFPEATVLFGDIVGFTAWSSMREPSQVFMLLEGLYSAFDDLALRRKVFKVETIGDCYVAVCGVPDPNPNHASVMVRFARDCLSAMNVVLQNLTIELGPSTTELGMRIGLHSGSVTAGVLRTNRARFQLFGDTVNTGKTSREMFSASFVLL